MNFLKRLFGSGDKSGEAYTDETGIYFYVRCKHCGAKVRVRADKQYDINRTQDGYVWHKTIVDNRCFRAMPTVVHLDENFDVVDTEIEGGEYITREEYEAPEPSAVEGSAEEE